MAQPDTGDDAVRAPTGRGWEAWCDILDAWPGRTGGHAAIAGHVQDEYGIDGWWPPASGPSSIAAVVVW